MTIYEVVRRPIVTEKGHTKKDDENTLCFEVHTEANKIHIKAAVENPDWIQDRPFVELHLKPRV